MAKSILRNMSREAVKFIKIYPIRTANSTDSVDDDTELTLANVETEMASATGLAIREVEPDWILGLKQQKVLGIEVTPIAFTADRANDDGSTIYWGYSSDTNIQTYDHKLEVQGSGVYMTNGKLTADYEHFFHGERGDQYRMVGWPDYIPTEYMVDPTKQYDYLQIHFYYRGDNEAVQKSEKDITLLCEKSGSPASSQANAIKAALIEIGVPEDAFQRPKSR
jgi:hypothetical protein